MPALNEQVTTLVRDLPDPEGALLFFERITHGHKSAARLFARDHGLLADALALAAWSPLLATTLVQHPDYLQWLARERLGRQVKAAEELGESLARFAATNSNLDPQVLLARFRRRELLRITIRDIRRTSTLVETTDELSNLADAVLGYALSLAAQRLDNLYGSPLATDARGRTTSASFSIVALGKLGSRELNYASDIDLMFLYSDDGSTAGTGERGTITNREYFVRLAEMITKIVGQPSGEGAAYRVDLRLRPHGRVGALSSSLQEAIRYYRETAQPWERQALIRARAAAGNEKLYDQFADEVRESVYQTGETVERALAHVRTAKRKIDAQHGGKSGGFNVKLGRGGIREIEFIAQALQLAYGSRDPWLHAPHTLISLGRLADRHLITEQEKSNLADAYTFLRTLEHRLQIEHGLQTHSVPNESAKRAVVARRMGLTEPHALENFNHLLAVHTANAHTAYKRVFGEAVSHTQEAASAKTPVVKITSTAIVNHQYTSSALPTNAHAESAMLVATASVFARRLANFKQDREAAATAAVSRHISEAASRTNNPRRALELTARVASSLGKLDAQIALTEADVTALVRLCGASEFFGDMIARNPALVATLTTKEGAHSAEHYRRLMFEAVESEGSFGARMTALRRLWARLLLEIGMQDAMNEVPLKESTCRQTALACASIDASCFIARAEMSEHYGELSHALSFAVLGLGRLGSGGMDYGSDLDVVLVYDDAAPSLVATLTAHEAYARFAELLITALSSVTRDGYLYRVDLRLRPDGKNGPLVSGARSFTTYLHERAAVWEWLAYVKLRAAAGDLELGRRVEAEARQAIHEAAGRTNKEALRLETRRVRARLKQERASGRAIDIKFSQGGMLDVYFAIRYLQLRDNVPDHAEDRSTHRTLERLRTAGSLKSEDYQALNDGYMLLRRLDHHLRLLNTARSTRLPASDHPALRDLAHSAGYSSATALTAALATQMAAIHEAYNRITGAA